MREELVDSAVKFLNDPQVAASSLAKRVEFLESKELTPEEVEEALKRAKDSGSTPTKVQPASSVSSGNYFSSSSFIQPSPPLPPRDWRDYFVMATVSAGIGYGIYEVAKRYVLPLIVPPTPASLEADKVALEAEFSRVESLLEQLKSDSDEVKEAERKRSEKFNDLVTQVEEAVELVKTQTQLRNSDMKLVKSQVENIKDMLPKSLEKHRELQDSALNDLQDELKSLKQLLGNRMKIATPEPHPYKIATNNQIRNSQSPSPAESTTVSNANGTNDTNGTNGSGSSTPRAGIPAWQLAASKNKEETAST